VNGLVGLVPAAELLAEIAGSRQGATRLAIGLLGPDPHAVVRGHDDLHVATREELIGAGVLTESGVPTTSLVAELVTVCEILANSTLPSPAPPPDSRLVLSAPPGTVPLADRERLDGFVLDVIRQATTSLTIGGAFWNDAGFELLDEVLLPAVQVRGIPTSVYVNTPDDAYLTPLQERLAALRAAGSVRIRWFVGPRPTMLHAKFVIRDNVHGYLGTANLTSWGLHGHIEAGVELTAGQSQRFVQFLEQLDAAGLFDASPRAER
jgi:hypothetical protein